MPDHIPLSLISLPTSRSGAFVVDAELKEELEVTTHAYEALLRDHLGFWIAPFLETLMMADSEVYRAAAAWLQGTLARLQA